MEFQKNVLKNGKPAKDGKIALFVSHSLPMILHSFIMHPLRRRKKY